MASGAERKGEEGHFLERLNRGSGGMPRCLSVGLFKDLACQVRPKSQLCRPGASRCHGDAGFEMVLREDAGLPELWRLDKASASPLLFSVDG